MMMALLNTHERTLDDFVKLAAAAGLSFVKLWNVGEMSAVEFRLSGPDSTSMAHGTLRIRAISQT